MDWRRYFPSNVELVPKMGCNIPSRESSDNLFLLFFFVILDVAQEREVEGDLILSDMGQGVPFRAGSFDGAVSISALQWLCNADKTWHNPVKRLYQFFSSLFASLSRTARAVFQFYPENSDQIELVTTQATKAGFFGGIVVDFPNSTKAKKFFLVLMTGGAMPLPKALGTDDDNTVVTYTTKRYISFRFVLKDKLSNIFQINMLHVY